MYILLMLLRDLCIYFPDSVYKPLEEYVPFLARLADRMNNSSKLMDIWCIIEALFFIGMQLKMQYLQSKDPLEASLSAAPMLDPVDRKILWDRMIDIEKDDPIAWISGWFFDQPIENISRYDVCDFICWSMFDGRNQEHLTLEELKELEGFVEDLEYFISLRLYSVHEKDEDKSRSVAEHADDKTSKSSELGKENSKTCTDNRRSSSSQSEVDSAQNPGSNDSQSDSLIRRPIPAKSKYLATCFLSFCNL